MKKSRFSEEQMVKILREADKTPVAEVAKKHGVSEQTIYVWRRRFGNMDVADTKKLKALEAENARLKKMVADREDHPDIALGLNNVAEGLLLSGRTDEALALNARALNLYIQAYGPASVEVAIPLPPKSAKAGKVSAAAHHLTEWPKRMEAARPHHGARGPSALMSASRCSPYQASQRARAVATLQRCTVSPSR
jgi:transposase-like protein